MIAELKRKKLSYWEKNSGEQTKDLGEKDNTKRAHGSRKENKAASKQKLVQNKQGEKTERIVKRKPKKGKHLQQIPIRTNLISGLKKNKGGDTKNPGPN